MSVPSPAPWSTFGGKVALSQTTLPPKKSSNLRLPQFDDRAQGFRKPQWFHRPPSALCEQQGKIQAYPSLASPGPRRLHHSISYPILPGLIPSPPPASPSDQVIVGQQRIQSGGGLCLLPRSVVVCTAVSLTPAQHGLLRDHHFVADDPPS